MEWIAVVLLVYWGGVVVQIARLTLHPICLKHLLKRALAWCLPDRRKGAH